MHLRQSVLSTEYVRIPVGVPTVDDPTTGTVAFSFPAEGAAPTAWIAAVWETSEPRVVELDGYHLSTPYKATLLVGPDGAGHPLTAGSYDVWIKVTDNPERVIRRVGKLEIF